MKRSCTSISPWTRRARPGPSRSTFPKNFTWTGSTMSKAGRQVVIATNNVGKLREFRQLLSELSLEILPQSDFGLSAAEETGLSFVENAILKARHACAGTGLPAIADDSGLAVDALRGAPGIYSARYSGENDDEANNRLLLENLKHVP